MIYITYEHRFKSPAAIYVHIYNNYIQDMLHQCKCFMDVSLTYDSCYYSILYMDPKAFFLKPGSPAQKQYEALKSFYADGLHATEAARKFNFSPAYFKKLRYQFLQTLKTEQNPFFPLKKTGPKGRFTDRKVIEQIVALRKQNHSIVDIRAVLEAKEIFISLDRHH